MVDFVRQVSQKIRFWHHHGGRVEIDQEAPPEPQRGCPLLQSAQHSLVGERRACHPGGQKLVAAAPMVRQVAAVTASEGAEVTLVGLLSCV